MAHLPPRLFTSVGVSAAGRATGTLLSIGTVAIVTRTLVGAAGEATGLSLYGTYATVLAYVAVLTIVGDGGLYSVLTREASREGANENVLLNVAWRLRLLINAALILLVSLVVFFLPLASAVRLGILIAVWGGAFQLSSQLLLGVFQKRLRLLVPALAEILGRAVQLGGVLVLARWFAPSVPGFLFAFVCGTVATLLWNVIGARRLVPLRLVGRSARPEVRRLLREAWPLGLSLILSHIFFKVDTVLLSLLQPAAHVALYALPYKVLESLLFFPAMVGGMLLPLFSRASSTHSSGASGPLRAATDVYLLLAFPLGALLFLTAPLVIDLLGGSAFNASVPVLRILAVTLGILCFGNMFGTALIAIGRQRQLLVLYACLTVLNVGVNLLVIPRFSYIGAAWTTLGTEALSVLGAGLLLLWYGVHLLGTSRTLPILLSGIALLGVFLLPLPLIPRAMLGLGLYVVLLFWLRVIRSTHVLALFRSPSTSV